MAVQPENQAGPKSQVTMRDIFLEAPLLPQKNLCELSSEGSYGSQRNNGGATLPIASSPGGTFASSPQVLRQHSWPKEAPGPTQGAGQKGSLARMCQVFFNDSSYDG